MIKKFKLFENISIEDSKILLSHFKLLLRELGYDYKGYYRSDGWISEYRKDGNFMFELSISNEFGVRKFNFFKNFYHSTEVDFIERFLKSLKGLSTDKDINFGTTFNVIDVNILISELTLDNFLTKKEMEKYNL